MSKIYTVRAVQYLIVYASTIYHKGSACDACILYPSCILKDMNIESDCTDPEIKKSLECNGYDVYVKYIKPVIIYKLLL